jgi:hypothetical protein
MGPNALPVPEVGTGRIDSSAELELAGEYHFSAGDRTKNFFTRGIIPLYKNRAAVSLAVVPYEWFSTDTLTRDTRAARTRSGKGGAGGDIYFFSEYQILRDRLHGPDLNFRACFRLASGTNLRNARYTDGPGYFFDISAGKNLKLGNNTLRYYGMAGFYAYQTFDLQHLQNDCFLYGAGADLVVRHFLISQAVAGYSGYLDIGDRPLVYRAKIRWLRNKFDWNLSYQWGLHDYAFQRFRFGVIFHLPPAGLLLSRETGNQ